MAVMTRQIHIAIIGGGPGGYEAALVAARLGAKVTLIERDGVGGSAVLTDCVPSKALVSTASAMKQITSANRLGISVAQPTFSLREVNTRIKELATAQSHDIKSGLERVGVTIVAGQAKLKSAQVVEVAGNEIPADVVLIATGARPRVLAETKPDGERILTWDQLYELQELPEHLIVVGSGVTGAEFTSAYLSLGSKVTLVSSRDLVLPGSDPDAARVIQEVFNREGGEIKSRSRAVSAKREGNNVVVRLNDGTELIGSHLLMAMGSIPNTDDLGLQELGILTDQNGFIAIDRVSRTNIPSIYAAGDCTGVLMLASVAAMQGRIAMWHALGEAVNPLNLAEVSSTVFTQPEIATVGDVSGKEFFQLPLRTNARAKMEQIDDGFVKIFSHNNTIVGGVVCSPSASELIHSITLAVGQGMSIEDFAQTITVYPSLSGSIAEATRRLQQN